MNFIEKLALIQYIILVIGAFFLLGLCIFSMMIGFGYYAIIGILGAYLLAMSKEYHESIMAYYKRKMGEIKE